VTYLLLGWAIVRTALVPKWIGWLSAVAGLGYIATAFVVGYEGFSDTLSAVSITAGVLFVIASIGIAVNGWRAREPAAPAAAT